MTHDLTVLAFAAATSTAAGALPAFAQSLSTQSVPASWKPLPQRQDQIAGQIADGVDKGTLSDLQARGLRDQFKGLLNLEDQYRKTGLTPAQQADLQASLRHAFRRQMDAFEQDRSPIRPASRSGAWSHRQSRSNFS